MRTLGCGWTMIAALLALQCSGSRSANDSVAVKRGRLEADVITIGPAGKDMNYFLCSVEGGACLIGGTRYMAYGAQGQYRFKNVGGWVNCNNSTFGGDPVPGVVKSCYFSNYGTDGLSAVITEGQTKTVNADVAFGANGAFSFRTFRNQSFTCNVSTFGDPVPGVVKACYLAVPMFTRVGSEGDPMYAVNGETIAYGANGRFIFARKSGSAELNTVTCSVDTFGEDPAYGVPKDCYRIVDGQRGTVSIGGAVSENSTWTVPTFATSSNVFYDSGRNGNVVRKTFVGTSGTCDNAQFDGDPDPNHAKVCWAAPFPIASQGTWTKLAASFPGIQGIEHVQLLMDGRVLVSDAGRLVDWYLFTPSSASFDGYRTGTWRKIAQGSNLGRRNFVSAMLVNGEYLVGGGEYQWHADGTGPFACSYPTNCAGFNRFEVFNPNSETWTEVPAFPFSEGVRDGNAAPLPNRNILVATSILNKTAEFQWDSKTWTATAESLPGAGDTDLSEAAMTQLQDGRVLFYGNPGAYVYDVTAPVGNKWSKIFGLPPNDPYDHGGEGGPALTLYDGTVFIVGANRFNGIYNASSGGTWANAPETPPVPPYNMQGNGHEDGQAVMPSGRVLMNVKSAGGWMRKFLEYSPGTSKFIDVSYRGPQWDYSSAVVETPLPDGSILVAAQKFKDVYLYRPGEPQQNTFAPQISSITGPVNGVYTLTGTGLNGLTNGANRDDEAQNFTSFPVVELYYGSGSTYALIDMISSTSIAPGATSTVQFRVPSGVPHGTLGVTVSASGLLSRNYTTIGY